MGGIECQHCKDLEVALTDLRAKYVILKERLTIRVRGDAFFIEDKEIIEL